MSEHGVIGRRFSPQKVEHKPQFLATPREHSFQRRIRSCSCGVNITHLPAMSAHHSDLFATFRMMADARWPTLRRRYFVGLSFAAAAPD